MWGAHTLVHNLGMKLYMGLHSYRARMKQDSGHFALQVNTCFAKALRGVCMVRVVQKKVYKDRNHCLVVDEHEGVILNIAE